MKHKVGQKITALLLIVMMSMTFNAFAQDELKRVTTAEAEAMIENGDIIIIDVRDAVRYGNGHIKGAINIPRTTDVSVYEAKLKKDDKVLLVCGAGVSSRIVGEMLIEKGFTNVTDILGGMMDWQGSVEK